MVHYLSDVYTGPQFLDSGPLDVVRQQLTAPDPPAGMKATRSGVNILVNAMFEEKAREPGIDIFITHDSVLAVFVGYLLRSIPDGDSWPMFLGGALLWKSDDVFMLGWRGALTRVELPR